MINAVKLALAVVLFGSSICIAQDSKDPISGFDLLKKFEGNWRTVSKSADGSSAGEATLSSRVVGRFWVINEHDGAVGAMKFTAIQTLGYDSKTKEFVGSWIDSISDFKWQYSGTQNAQSRKLTLNAEGPDWNNPDEMASYRDVYEFKSDDEIAAISQIKSKDGEWETFITSTITRVKKTAAVSSPDEPKNEIFPTDDMPVAPFLMFQGNAVPAIELYKSVFPDLKIVSMKKYKKGEAGPEDTIQLAVINVEGQHVKISDSPPVHDFTFTPSFSFFVQCKDEEELKKRFEQLSKDGKVMMPINNYGFSKKFGWCSDKFGVSWQLNLQ